MFGETFTENHVHGLFVVHDQVLILLVGAVRVNSVHYKHFAFGSLCLEFVDHCVNVDVDKLVGPGVTFGLVKQSRTVQISIKRSSPQENEIIVNDAHRVDFAESVADGLSAFCEEELGLGFLFSVVENCLQFFFV